MWSMFPLSNFWVDDIKNNDNIVGWRTDNIGLPGPGRILKGLQGLEPKWSGTYIEDGKEFSFYYLR